MTKTLTKSIRLSIEDSKALADIIENDPRVQKGSSEALRICFEDAANNIPVWKSITKKMKTIHFNDNYEVNKSEIKSFLVGEETFNKVVESINNQLGTTRPRISFITRMCIYNTRIKLYESNTQNNSDSQNLLNKKALLSNEEFEKLSIDEKLNEIYRLLCEK